MQMIEINFKNSAVKIAVPDFFCVILSGDEQKQCFYEYIRSAVAKEKIWDCR